MASGEKILPVVVGDVRKRMKKEIYRVLKDARCPHKKKQDLDLKKTFVLKYIVSSRLYDVPKS